MTPKPGRPPRSLVTATERIELRVTPDELKTLARAAGSKPLGTWLRDIGLKAAKRKPSPTP